MMGPGTPIPGTGTMAADTTGPRVKRVAPWEGMVGHEENLRGHSYSHMKTEE
jgi:hypothetical protein